ncbi:hypothetical protein [Kitasatospora sp. NPDC093806]
MPVGRELLFYRAGNGAAVSGRLDTEGGYADLVKNGGFSPGWSIIVALTA